MNKATGNRRNSVVCFVYKKLKKNPFLKNNNSSNCVIIQEKGKAVNCYEKNYGNNDDCCAVISFEWV